MKKQIIVVYSSHLSEEIDNKFNEHIKNTIGTKHKIVRVQNNNQYPLSKVYNDELRHYMYLDDAIIVFCHNDIIFRTRNWGRLLLGKFNNSEYGILGVAGTTFIPESGRWWDDRSKMYGIVDHTDGLNEWTSEYSEPINGIKDVVHIDGLFMAVYPERIDKHFNEDYGKFHFYDLTFCVDNYNDDVNIGVITDIRILHKSVGETNQNWELNRLKFVKEYGDDLPIKLVPEKLRVLICCQFFNNYTGSEMSNYELSKELVKLGCDVTLISGQVGDPLASRARKNGVKVYSVSTAPNYMVTQENQLTFIKTQAEFDIIHVNHKPMGQQILQMYPNTPAVMHVRSEVIPIFEEPYLHPQIKKYISIRDSVTEFIKKWDISDDKIVLIDNPFDYTRFNTNYVRSNNQKEVILFVGTLDHLRKNILFDLKEMVEKEDKMLWIIGANNGGYVNELLKTPISESHVRYFGVKSNVEDYVKKCDYTAGIFKGRTTIEGYLCGKPGWIYTVDKEGNILSKELKQVPEDVAKYRSDVSASKVFNLYEEVINESWFG